MSELPKTLGDAIPKQLLADARNWWHGLSEEDRAELERLCDARKEIFLFETFEPGENNPRITGGKFIPHDDSFGLKEWGEDYFDYLLGHPELMIVFDPTNRKFHIGCHRHPAVRECFRMGRIEEDFRCPFASNACPIDRLRGRSQNKRLRLIKRWIKLGSSSHLAQ